MKKIFIGIFILLSLLIIKIPPYVELNNLAIIDSVGVSYNDRNYTVYLKEIIPIKDENGITYEYEYYKGNGSSIDACYRNIKNKTKKKLYLKRIKLLITNLKNSDNILEELDINPEEILHSSENIYKELKKS